MKTVQDRLTRYREAGPQPTVDILEDSVVRIFTSTVTIDRSADDVWKRLTDWDTADAWMSGVDRMAASGDTAVGTTLGYQARGKDRTSTITAVQPGRSITITASQGGVTTDYTYTVEPDGTRARARLEANFTARGLMWKITGPLIRSMIRRADSAQLDALKRHVENR